MKTCPACGAKYDDAANFCMADGARLDAASSVDPYVGRLLDGRYRIERLIARGGMGAIYRAKRVHIGDDVAIKVFRPDPGTGNTPTTGGSAIRFRREARAAAMISHPNAVTIFDFGETGDGLFYIAMELLEGKTLRREIQESGRLSLERTLEILRPVCAAVHSAHQKGVIHRDLKPANIMTRRMEDGSEQVKVLDFGIAKIVGSPADYDAPTAVGLTMGTAAYMSPEQCSGRPVDQRSDVFSLGVILYECLTGRLPFPGRTPEEVVVQQARGPVPPTAHEPTIPPGVEAAILHALVVDPGDRTPTARRLLEEIEAGLMGAPLEDATDVMPASGPPGPRSLEGRTIAGRFHIEEYIGVGRFDSSIYRALDVTTGKAVAVRVIWKFARQPVEVHERLRREAESADISHPHLLPVRAFGEFEFGTYTVTDLVGGPSLRQVINDAGTLDVSRAVEILSQIAAGVAALHDGGRFATGLSPEIIRVPQWEEGRDHVLISVAGISVIQEVLEILDERQLRGRELVDTTPLYLAPELFRRTPPDARSDVYSIGAIGYEMLTGRVPHYGVDLLALLASHLAPYRPVREVRPDTPEVVAAVIERAIALAPEDRFSTVNEMRAAFAEAAIVGGRR